MKIEIKHRFTGTVIFSHEAENNTIKLTVEAAVNLRNSDLSNSNLRNSNLRNSDLSNSNLRNSDLSYSDLRNSDLSNSDLSNSNLRNSDLSGATYGNGIPFTKPPLQLTGLKWPILIMDTHIKIGCELHPTSDWAGFKNSRIKLMDANALDFWATNKDLILMAANLHQTKKS